MEVSENTSYNFPLLAAVKLLLLWEIAIASGELDSKCVNKRSLLHSKLVLPIIVYVFAYLQRMEQEKRHDSY